MIDKSGVDKSILLATKSKTKVGWKYTEANSQRNTDFGVLFLFYFIFIQIFFIDNTFRQ